jgi:hypothetical protein
MAKTPGQKPMKKITPTKETPVDPVKKAKEVANTAIEVASQKPQWLIEAEAAASPTAATSSSDYLGSISTEGGKFSVEGHDLKAPVKLAVLDSTLQRTFYKEAWRKGTKATPVCFAYGQDEKTMTPHPESAEEQHTSCAGCPQSAWGSDGGKGQSCKTRVKLAVVLPSSDPESIVEAEVKTLSVPTGSLKKWGAYVGQCKQVTGPLDVRGVVTECDIESLGGGFGLTFKPVAKLALEQLKFLLERTKALKLREKLTQPFQPSVEEEKPAPKGKRKF